MQIRQFYTYYCVNLFQKLIIYVSVGLTCYFKNKFYIINFVVFILYYCDYIAISGIMPNNDFREVRGQASFWNNA